MIASPRRILYVNHAADLYGASRALLHLIQSLDRDRYMPLVVLPGSGPLVAELRALGVDPLFAPGLQTLWGHLLRSWRLLPFTLRLLPSGLALRRVVRQCDADLVHSNLWTLLSGTLGARLAGVPHIWHVREILPSMGGMRSALAAFTLRSSQRVICISYAVADQFAARRGAERVRVVYDGLPIDGGQAASGERREDRATIRGEERSAHAAQREDAQAANPKPQVSSLDDVVVGLVGRLHPQKGQADLLHAYALLDPGLRARCRLVLAGGPSPGHERHARALADLARQLGIAERVTFLGFVEHARALIESFDILALPATKPEGLGGVLLEAMAARVPVIATIAGGTAEVVEDGTTGLLVAPRDPYALSRALAQLLADPSLRGRMGAAGRRAVEQRFSAARMAAEMMSIYDEILPPSAGVSARHLDV